MNTPLRIFGTAIVAVAGLLMTLVNAPLAHATTTTIVTLSFDDGPSDDTQLPTLLQGLPATLFINSGRVGSNGYLSWDQITTLAGAGYEIGGHTVTHADLPTLSTDEQKREVCDDRTALLDHGFAVTSFAYPYGDNTPDTETIVKDCGYNGARTVGSLWSNTSCSACAATDTVPPADAYDVATPDSIKSGTTLADLQNLVTHAETGGGWLPLVFHHLCTTDCPVYSVDPTVLSDFAAWLKTQSGVSVQTFGSVIGGSVQPAVAGPPAAAAVPGDNMLKNPSVETVSSGTTPDCWMQGHLSTGTSATFTHSTTAHTGSYAERIDVSSISSGDAKLVSTQDLGQCAPTVTPGHYYVVSGWYESDVQPVLVVFYRDSSGHWAYYTQSKPALAPSGTWQQASLTIQAPAGATAVSVGMAITAAGFVAMDDFSVIEDHPTATLTAPADGSTVKGVTSVTADASAPSPDAVSKVELLVDGAVVDSTTTAPYAFAWNSAAHQDGTASLAVRATDTQGNAATSPSILVSIANNPPSGSTGSDTTAPSVTFYAPPVASLAAKVRLAWFGSDSGTGIASYDVRYRRAPFNKGFGAWTYPSTWQHATVGSVKLAVARGYDYCVQVRARDNAGNLTAWSVTRCLTRPLDDRALKASRGWTRGKGKGFYLGTYTATSARNASLVLAGAQVDRLGIVATKCAKCGTIAIYVGKKLIRKVSLKATKTRKAQLILLPRFAFRKGTITIKVLTSRKTVQIDGLVACRS